MVVIALDQSMKYWAWRHATVAIINPAGSIIAGTEVGTWYAGRFTGAALDFLSFASLVLATTIIARRRLPYAIATSAGLMIGGWSSNLIDRLGLHYWTAPGSIRGAVDFIPAWGYLWNIADIFTAVGTAAFLLSVGYQRIRRTQAPARLRCIAVSSHRRPRAGTRMSILAVALFIIIVVGVGAADFGGVATSAPSE